MPTHGKYATYNNHDCRCEPCVEAARQYMARYRATENGRQKTREANRIAARTARLAAKYIRETQPELWSQFQQTAKNETKG